MRLDIKLAFMSYKGGQKRTQYANNCFLVNKLFDVGKNIAPFNVALNIYANIYSVCNITSIRGPIKPVVFFNSFILINVRKDGTH